MRKNFWVSAVVWRCISYALSLGVCFCLMAFGVCLLFLFAVPDLMMIAVLGSTLIGFVGGGIAGFYSPPTSRDARFLSSVIETSAAGFGYGALGGIVGGLSFLFMLSNYYLAFYFAMAVALFVAFAGQIWGLWNAINKLIHLRNSD